MTLFCSGAEHRAQGSGWAWALEGGGHCFVCISTPGTRILPIFLLKQVPGIHGSVLPLFSLLEKGEKILAQGKYMDKACYWLWVYCTGRVASRGSPEEQSSPGSQCKLSGSEAEATAACPSQLPSQVAIPVRGIDVWTALKTRASPLKGPFTSSLGCLLCPPGEYPHSHCWPPVLITSQKDDKSTYQLVSLPPACSHCLFPLPPGQTP